MVGIVKDPLYLEHDPGNYHPESPDRLGHIYSMLPSIDGDGVLYVTPRMATHQEVALIHDASYIESIARTEGCTASLDPDTSTSPRTYEASLLAAGGCLSLADSILSGVVRSGFALIRPPGHHAERSRALRVCLFNTMASAARSLQGAHGAGSSSSTSISTMGTDTAQFLPDPSVLYFSTHQFPYHSRYRLVRRNRAG